MQYGAINFQVDATKMSVQPELLRLRRWPPQELLHNDRHRVKMAALLGNRFFAVSELAELTQQPIEKCRRFVSVLKYFDLLMIQVNQKPIETTQQVEKNAINIMGGIMTKLRLAA
jgi:hypothetical protein